MFLRPQHFQQQDRYVERLVRARTAALTPHPWGLSAIEINRELLTIGKFGVRSAAGVFEDGTPFAIPEDADHPAPLEIPENTRNCIVYLTLPIRHHGAFDVELLDNPESATRYQQLEYEATDANSGSESEAIVGIGKLRLRFALATEERAGFLSLGLARITEIRADRNILLDERYIPPCLVCSVSPGLAGLITELQGLFHHRGEALAARVLPATGTRGVPETSDYLLLQLVNRYEPLITHLTGGIDPHPERLYALALEMAGELSTFTNRTRRPPGFPLYRHDDLERTFAPVIAQLHQSLSAVLRETAVRIELEERPSGEHVGIVRDRSLYGEAVFVLGVRADMPAEHLRRHFPNYVKIAPVERIRELVNVAIPGIPVRPLPAAPYQIPLHADVTYFQLERGGPYWNLLPQSGGIAIFLAGEFPRVGMDLWAIRG
jgi:type VI secretion system protein ImpJ